MFCPFIKSKCRQDCELLAEMAIKNNITGETKIEKRCVFFWYLTILMEQNKLQLTTTQAVESFRDNVVKGQGVFEVIAEGIVGLVKLTSKKNKELPYVEAEDKDNKDALPGG